jgi:hypothetical protein
MDAVLLSQLSHKNRKEKQTMDLSTCKILSISDLLASRAPLLWAIKRSIQIKAA